MGLPFHFAAECQPGCCGGQGTSGGLFFIYDDDGDIKKPDTSTNQYQQEFYLYFVTREKMDLDKFKIIEMCDDHRLLFNSCETQVGKIEDLDVEASMTTFTFIHVHRMCRG